MVMELVVVGDCTLAVGNAKHAGIVLISAIFVEDAAIDRVRPGAGHAELFVALKAVAVGRGATITVTPLCA
jgi:hypothetical protein